jgi:uncharacterized protein YndB with AHSA1/START domain
MIVLQDTVTIHAPAPVVWAWLERLPEHYREWHRDHISCRWVRAGAFVSGAEMEVVERLHGKPHRLRMRVIDVEPGHRIRYRIFPGLEGSLAVRPAGSGTRFTATIQMGIRTPVLGTMIDALMRWAIPARIESIRQHQAEEGANLKAVLEDRYQGAGERGPG